MTEQLRIKHITLRVEGSTAYALLELTEPLAQHGSHVIGIEYTSRGELRQAVVRWDDGVPEANSFLTYGGSLHQVSKSFGGKGDTVTLTIAKWADPSDVRNVEITGFLEANGERVQSDVPVEVI